MAEDISASNSTQITEEVDLNFLEAQKQLCFENKSDFENSINVTQGVFCPRIFDGWACWPETEAGQTAFQQCPYFITGFDPNRKGHKKCLEDGSWFRHPQTNVTWSNYTTCVDLQELAWRQNVIIIQEVGYLISLCALIISLIIFCSFRSLQCTRVRIHKHLFVSFIVNNTLWLIWYRVISVPEVPQNPENTIWCASLHILVQYFLVANYFWMFCEGFYLHALIVFTFLARYESRLLLGFYITGWFGPAIPTILYTAFRGLDPNLEETTECWIRVSQWTYFLSVPVCFSLILSLLFLINILRVLVLKLSDNRRHSLGRQSQRHSQAGHGDESQNAIRKAARATLILIPLLGLHYLLTPLRPNPGTEQEIIYEYITAVSLSLQGLCVSLLFCFCNGEVILTLKRRFCPQQQIRLKFLSTKNSASVSVKDANCPTRSTISTMRTRKCTDIEEESKNNSNGFEIECNSNRL